jgi:energy-coupling factor transport system substrate-specific component
MTVTTAARVVRLRGRSAFALLAVTAVSIAAFGWPLFAGNGSAVNGGGLPHSNDAPWLFVALLPLLLAVLFAELSDGSLDAKGVAMLGVLAACGAAMRPLGAGVTGFNAVFFLLVPAGRVFGRGFGFVLGALTLFASALLTAGVGPWLPFQMLAAGWIGMFAGVLPRARGRAELVLLADYGALASIAYGFVLNLWFWPFGSANVGTAGAVAFLPHAPLADNLRRWLSFSLTTSLGFDVPRAAVTALALLLVGRPVLLALRRAARRAAFDVPVEFAP